MISENKRIKIDGFMAELAEFTGDNFRFSDIALRDILLEGGRHFFTSQMPDVEGIEATVDEAISVDPNTVPYDPSREPTIMLEIGAGTGVIPSSSRGSRHVWTVTILLRLGKVPEFTRELLEELFEFYIQNLDGACVGPFLCKGAEPIARPTTLTVLKDDHVITSAIIRFRGVPFVF